MGRARACDRKGSGRTGGAARLAVSLALVWLLPACFLDFKSNRGRNVLGGSSSQLAAEIVWTGASTVSAGDCHQYRLSVLNLQGEPISPAEPILLYLTSVLGSAKLNDVFYSDPSCVSNFRLPMLQDSAEYTFPAGTFQAFVYVRQTRAGDTKLRVTSPDQAYRSGDFRVHVLAAGLARIEIRGQRQISVNSCTQYSAVRVDVFGNPIQSGGSTPVTIDKGTSDAKLYLTSDTGCATPSNQLSGSIPGGQSTFHFRMKSTRAGEVDLSGSNGPIHVVSVLPGSPAALFFDGPDALAVDQCGEYQVVRQDPDANPSRADVALALSLSPSTGFFSDPACASSSGGVAVIPAGSDRTAVYFRHNSVDPAISLSVSAANHAPGGKLIEVRSPGGKRAYGSGGARVIGPGWATSAVLDGDGKLVVAGYRPSGAGLSPFVARLTTAGALDTSFNSTGVRVVSEFGSPFDMANAVAVDGAGKIWIAGVTKDGATKKFAVARLSSNGVTVELVIKTDVSSDGRDDLAHAIAIQPDDGHVIAAGSSVRSNGKRDMAIVRYHSGTGAVLSQGVVDFEGEDDGAYAIFPVTNTEIYVAGYAQKGRYQDMALARLGAGLAVAYEKRFDFGQNHHDVAHAVQVSGGRVWIAGSTRIGAYQRIAVASAVPSTGDLDSAFSDDGRVVTAFRPQGNAAAYAISVNATFVTVAGMMQDSAGRNGAAIARYHLDGELDDSFASRGKLSVHFGARSDEARALVLSDTDLFIAGSKGLPSGFEAIAASFSAQ